MSGCGEKERERERERGFSFSFRRPKERSFSDSSCKKRKNREFYELDRPSKNQKSSHSNQSSVVSRLMQQKFLYSYRLYTHRNTHTHTHREKKMSSMIASSSSTRASAHCLDVVVLAMRKKTTSSRESTRRAAMMLTPVTVEEERESADRQMLKLKRRRDVLSQTTAAILFTNSVAAVAGDSDDVVLIDAPEGYAYESSQIQTNNALRRKIWSDESSILKEKAGVNYSIEFPERFAALTDVSSARVVGVDCSFKDPRDEASTLAIFINTLPPDKRTLKDSYVSIDSKAKQMALSAKNQRTKRKEKYTKQGVGEIWEIETEVGGGTAGRFGAAVELISLFVVNEKVEVTVRATGSLSSWKKLKKELRECVRSFELLQ